MITYLGLIVATYAIFRLVQVPIEMSESKEVWLGMPFMIRFMIVAGVSALGVLLLLVFTLLMLISSSGGGKL